MNNVREPAVAGLFYAAAADQLERDLDALMSHTRATPGPAPKALIVPHAGYVYSGPVAAAAYRMLVPLRHVIRRVVLFGPAHRVYLDGMALPDANRFITPLGTVLVDADLTSELAKLPGVCISAEAHRQEHSLEVQLPFLQTVLEQFKLVPVVVGQCDAQRVADVMDAAWGGPETLIVVSSDLSHYLPYRDAQQIDANTCSQILDKASTLTGDEACGAYALNGLMRAQHCERLTVETVDLRNSGDTAGDKDRVVGYGAFILY